MVSERKRFEEMRVRGAQWSLKMEDFWVQKAGSLCNLEKTKMPTLSWSLGKVRKPTPQF